MNILKISESLNKAYRRNPIIKNDMVEFHKYLRTYFLSVKGQGQEKNKETYLRDFLRDTFYRKNDINKPNESDIDWAIRFGDQDSPVGVIIEDKTQSNKQEMITTDDLNHKAMHQLIYYYLEERIGRNNVDVRHLIANNMYEFFVFDGRSFEKYFHQNKKLVKDYNNFKSGVSNIKGTDNFYDYIGETYVKDIQKEIPFTYFDLQKYASAIKNEYPTDKELAQLVPLYRIFSDIHLLKLPFQNDNNSLNTGFYVELLHILGLEEVKDKDTNKNIIRRLPTGKANTASLIELTINQIRKKLYKITERANYGQTEEEQLFNLALELCITWINRVLFLKLLESQLLKYHKDDASFRFLTIEKISDFDLLNYLFFDVLAVDYEKRKEYGVKPEFEKVPYLNSSLFEETDLEGKLININALMQTEELPILNHSILRKSGGIDPKKKQLPILEYLFAFLNSYNFASEGDDEDIRENPKSIISASVLGLIFEKINGHKDGAVFTPGYVTMYMAHEAVRRTIIQKFNDTYKEWKCKTEIDLWNKIDTISIEEANAVFNSIKICDPAVGSGHFLVSALNEMICAKYDLGILADKEGRIVKKKNYKIEIENDELIVSVLDDGESELFCYHPRNNDEEQRIQELLFNEKRTIIENCLFGVDLNPNSVNICRLRLWIELLKNSYYTAESNYQHLETLPNIDINIKCGNSVVSKYPLTAMMNSSASVKEYKKAVADYKRTANKEKKYKIEQIINEIKSQISSGLRDDDAEYKAYTKMVRRYNDLTEKYSEDLFGYSKKELRAKNKEIKSLKAEIEKKRIRIEEKKSNAAFKGQNPFEWRFEFPEILDDDGAFIGFDCIVTNPPYIEFKKLGSTTKKFLERFLTAKGKYDLFVTFIELSNAILKIKGQIASINPTTFMKRDYGNALRNYIKRNLRIYKILDFCDSQIFPSATTYTGLFFFSKELEKSYSFDYHKYTAQTKAKDIENNGFGDYDTSYRQIISVNCDELEKDSWVFLNPEEDKLFSKLCHSSLNMESICKYIFVGIQSGKDAVFFVNDRDIEEYSLEKDIIYPILKGEDVHSYKYNWGGTYIIYPYDINNHVIDESTMQINYPNVYAYLSEKRKMLSGRGYFDRSNKVWYELWCERNLAKFRQRKIVNCEISNDNRFSIDDNYYLGNTKVFCSVLKNEYNHLYEYVTVLLNSKLMNYVTRQISTPKAGGAYEHKTQFINKYPIRINEKFVDRMNDIYQQIFNSNDANRENILKKADKIVYYLYGLTYEDIMIVDPKTPITREEYEGSLKLPFD